MRSHSLLLVYLSVTGGQALFAQSEPVTLRYSATQINCARFVETVATRIVTQSGGKVGEQTAGRRGVWQFRAQPSENSVSLEGWLDSLGLWRRSKETTIRPDTDGLLGGRYRGTLSAQGVYQSKVIPFVPDEVAEIADMATALDDFFPALPLKPLRPGQAWSDSSRLTLRRLADSGMSGVPLYRFELQAKQEARSAVMSGDTTPVRLRQVTREQGRFVWHPSVGLIRRDRLIVVETNVPAGRMVRQPVRSKIEQRITLVRDLHTPPEIDGRCGAPPS